ncbi:MAG: GtrA family protein [Nitrososphaerota archaeon]|nr:GtrA family protein [Candidatus Geocrenenecus dongiae]
MSFILKLIEKVVKKIISTEFLKFNVVGGVGVVVNLLFYILFNDYLHIHYIISGALATELAIINNFILNDIWTFRDRKKTRLWVRFSLFHASRILGLLVTLGTLYVMVDILKLNEFFSYVIAVGIGVIINFYTSDVYVWIKR